MSGLMAIVCIGFMAVSVFATTNTDYHAVMVAGANNVQTGQWVNLNMDRNRFTGIFTAGTNVLWDDLRFPMVNMRITADFPPTFGTWSNGVKAYYFEDSGVMQSYGWIHFPDTWRTGSVIYPQIHIGTAAASTNWFTFGLEYTWALDNGAFDPVATMVMTQQLPNAAMAAQSYLFPPISGVGKGNQSVLGFRLYRDPGDGADSAGDIAVFEFDIKYQIYSPSGHSL